MKLAPNAQAAEDVLYEMSQNEQSAENIMVTYESVEWQTEMQVTFEEDEVTEFFAGFIPLQ